jgi:hypothetical protein
VFRRDVGGFVRAYDFLSQIVDYRDTNLEKRSLYLESAILAQQAAANQKTQFGESRDFMSAFEDAVFAAYENHKSLSEQVMAKGNVKKAMAAILRDLVYQGFEERRRSA